MALILVFRLMRPERLVNPETFATLVLYLQGDGDARVPASSHDLGLRQPECGDFPDRWGEAFFHLSLAWSCAAALAFIVDEGGGGFLFRRLHEGTNHGGKALPSQSRHAREAPSLFRESLRSGMGICRQGVRTFFRDQTQWPQLFLIAALIVIYLYNFSVLPWDNRRIRTIYLQNIFSFLNMGLAAFVLTAVAARFVYPAVSFEGDAFWIVRAAPISLRTFLWVKFAVYYLPLLFLAEILIVSSNILLQVTPFMMALSVVTIFLMVPGVVAMGVGLGAAYPDFQSENPAQSVTSFGGLLFMLLAAGFHCGGDRFSRPVRSIRSSWPVFHGRSLSGCSGYGWSVRFPSSCPLQSLP